MNSHSILAGATFLVLMVNLWGAVYSQDWHAAGGYLLALWFSACFYDLEKAVIQHVKRMKS